MRSANDPYDFRLDPNSAAYRPDLAQQMQQQAAAQGTPYAGTGAVAAPGGTATSGAAPVAAPASLAAPATPQTVQGAFQNVLQNLLAGPSPQQAGANVMQSPAVSAYRNALQSREGKDRALLAERAAAGGFSGSGGFDAGVLGLRQAMNRDLGTFAAGRAGEAEQGRRQELLSALGLANAFGDQTAARGLQRDLGFAQLGQNQNQFLDTLGFNYANMGNNLNAQILSQLLGGL